MVLKEDGAPRLFWIFAKIQNLLQSDDDMTRAATYRLVRGDKGKTTELRRPIQHLIPLEIHMKPELSGQIAQEVSTTPKTDIQTATRSRPRRTAAIIYWRAFA